MSRLSARRSSIIRWPGAVAEAPQWSWVLARVGFLRSLGYGSAGASIDGQICVEAPLLERAWYGIRMTDSGGTRRLTLSPSSARRLLAAQNAFRDLQRLRRRRQLSADARNASALLDAIVTRGSYVTVAPRERWRELLAMRPMTGYLGLFLQPAG